VARHAFDICITLALFLIAMDPGRVHEAFTVREDPTTTLELIQVGHGHTKQDWGVEESS
jgi:hypothetical protein